MILSDYIIIIALIVGAIAVGLYFLNRWASKKGVEQQSMIDTHKTAATIFVIDKKKDKAANANLPKAVMENLPKMYRFAKLYFVMAKIGPQIATLICDKNVYNSIPVKKNVKVELAGIYIVSVKGMKTPEQIKQMNKNKSAAKNSGKKTPN